MHSLLASKVMSMNLRVVPFLQPHPIAVYQKPWQVMALLLFDLQIASLSANMDCEIQGQLVIVNVEVGPVKTYRDESATFKH